MTKFLEMPFSSHFISSGALQETTTSGVLGSSTDRHQNDYDQCLYGKCVHLIRVQRAWTTAPSQGRQLRQANPHEVVVLMGLEVGWRELHPGINHGS